MQKDSCTLGTVCNKHRNQATMQFGCTLKNTQVVKINPDSHPTFRTTACLVLPVVVLERKTSKLFKIGAAEETLPLKT